jgi:formylglycine-generating enzyme required for sulfatase activity
MAETPSSKGINIASDQGDVTIGGDVIGGDKITHETTHLHQGIPVIWLIIGSLLVLAGVGAVYSWRNAITVPMVYVEAGPFTMGTNRADAKPDARPAHVVTLNAYWIDRSEVTNEQYQRFVKDTRHRAPLGWKTGGYPNGRDNYPVVGVSWEDAQAYCAFVQKRLPTEAEWEKAARGTDERLWPWGNDPLTANANIENDSLDYLSAAGSYPLGRSPYGADDMAGNVMEWVEDWYDSVYYSVSPPDNPTGPGLGETKVLRGGASPGALELARTFVRIGSFRPSDTNLHIGFRCACTACQHK